MADVLAFPLETFRESCLRMPLNLGKAEIFDFPVDRLWPHGAWMQQEEAHASALKDWIYQEWRGMTGEKRRAMLNGAWAREGAIKAFIRGERTFG